MRVARKSKRKLEISPHLSKIEESQVAGSKGRTTVAIMKR